MAYCIRPVRFKTKFSKSKNNKIENNENYCYIIKNHTLHSLSKTHSPCHEFSVSSHVQLQHFGEVRLNYKERPREQIKYLNF